MLPPALLGCTWRFYGSANVRSLTAAQPIPALIPASLQLSYPSRCRSPPSTLGMLGAAFLFISKVLTAPLCPSMGFLLWAFLSVLVKRNRFVPSQELGAALR